MEIKRSIQIVTNFGLSKLNVDSYQLLKDFWAYALWVINPITLIVFFDLKIKKQVKRDNRS